MKTIKLTGDYIVDQVVKKSKARYAEGIEPGDKIRFELEMVRTIGASNGNYTLYADMYVNGNLKCNISQNEFSKLTQIMDLIPISEISKDDTMDNLENKPKWENGRYKIFK